MRARSDRRPNRKNDRKVIVTEESNKNWADTDSDSSSSSSSSSDSEQDRTKERSKDRSKDRRMRARSDRRPNRKNDRKVIVTEESNKNWADTDSDSSSSSSSSSDSEQEEVHCLMANQTSEDEVFDFSNIEFTREDLITALNEMVHEYRKLSQTFEEVKAKNVDLKNSSVEPSTVELGKTDSLQIELSKLKIENESLRIRSSELESEIEKLKLTMSSWTQSSISLDKLCEIQKPANDRTGLCFNTGESSSGETCTQSNLAHDKFKKMSFVKASVIHDPCESVRYDDQISELLNKKGKAGSGYDRPESSKSGWLKNRLDKEKAKAGSKSFVQNQQRRGSKKVKSEWEKNQQRRGSKKVKSEWEKVRPRRDLNGQNIKPTLNRSHNISAQTLMDYHNGKTVKRLTDLLEDRVVVLDSPCCGASFDSSLGGCGWLERNPEVTASFVSYQISRNPVCGNRCRELEKLDRFQFPGSSAVVAD
ncbi:hypothetical protein F511_28909 [Dorcoceras hygrometricum]|uniref:Uncharacterized protein n=1 Tax=Dorcoceras hygrometricum TaxID=472368 RepID=A0A2Z7C2T6_9LAMI|nr:hypothetical protein F511_28909 [Dorcoceras hygrometricum]